MASPEKCISTGYDMVLPDFRRYILTVHINPNTVKNTLKELLARLDITVYRLAKDAGLSMTTAYGLVSDPDKIPSGAVMGKICTALLVQPGDFLTHTPVTDRTEPKGE